MRFVLALACAALLAAGGDKVAPAPADALTGRWQVVSMLANGKPASDDEIGGSIFTFTASNLAVHDGKGKDTAYACVIDGGYLQLTQPSGTKGWMKYELREHALRLAFFDGLGEKPKSFEPSPGGDDPMLIVLRLAPLR